MNTKYTLRQVPELLAPAGNMQKLKAAILYGANAVYLAGQRFGLRSAADNFGLEELAQAVRFAHSHQAKVYLTLNSFLHDSDFEGLEEFIRYGKEVGIDAVIVSDLGIARVVQKIGGIDLHVSTQASVNNVYAAKVWQKVGAKRIIVGRELSILEASQIKKATGMEVEMFIHGSMCMAYSGHCVISNYTQGRDSNRGGCAHSCRFDYELDATPYGKDKISANFMSSKDLLGINQMELMIEAGIDSVKVEGRMKSELYAAVTSKVYSAALKAYAQNIDIDQEQVSQWIAELERIPHRAYTEASLLTPADETSVFDERDGASKGFALAAQVVASSEQEGTILEIRQAFNVGDTLEFVPFCGDAKKYQVGVMHAMDGSELTRSKPSSLIKVPYLPEIAVHNLVRQIQL